MKTVFKIYLSLLFIVGRNQLAFADFPFDQNCVFSGSPAQTPPFVPITGTNKVLIIFV